MPLEIRELIIRTQIVTDETPTEATGLERRLSTAEQKALIEECVEKVLQRIHKQRQR